MVAYERPEKWSSASCAVSLAYTSCSIFNLSSDVHGFLLSVCKMSDPSFLYRSNIPVREPKVRPGNLSSMVWLVSPALDTSMRVFFSSRVQRVSESVDESFLGAFVLVLSICAGSAFFVSATAGCRASDNFVPAASRVEEADAEM
jgi:hypothetical protein